MRHRYVTTVAVLAALSPAAVLSAQPKATVGCCASAFRSDREAPPAAYPLSVISVPQGSRIFRQGTTDAWFGRDKLLHFVVAGAIQSATYAPLRSLGATRVESHVGASFVTAGASLGKEWLDWRAGGIPSRRDLVWDAAGAATASLLIGWLDRR